ncbi:MAG: His/Gly/Thr/Pro-type tRNA ligase C-terminal domain-containing protein [Parcubacteria group bacterium]
MAKKEIKKEKEHLESITDKIGEIAIHYGFTIIKPPQVTNDDLQKARQFKDFDYYGDAEEKVALTRWYTEEKHELEAQPLSIHYKKPLQGSLAKKKNSHECYGFEIIGSNRSTSEALLIKCALSILEELDYKDLCVDINSIGDRESISKFERELNNYFRKNAPAIPAKIRQELKKNPYSIVTNTNAEIKEVLHNSPEPISSLSDVSRTHFKEVLESLETFDVAYKIKPNILSNKLYASYTIFEIRSLGDKAKNEESELLAYGYRYNHLAKKMGAKKDIPTIGLTILVKKNPKLAKKVIIKNIKKPRFYLIQLGPSAKIKALNVVEMLRKHKIPVYHSITKDKITGQLSGAEYMKATHVLIMGQKEAIENSMVVRNVITREQETVSLSELGNFLKTLEEPKSVVKKAR